MSSPTWPCTGTDLARRLGYDERDIPGMKYATEQVVRPALIALTEVPEVREPCPRLFRGVRGHGASRRVSPRSIPERLRPHGHVKRVVEPAPGAAAAPSTQPSLPRGRRFEAATATVMKVPRNTLRQTTVVKTPTGISWLK
jgi:hypothetical protein